MAGGRLTNIVFDGSFYGLLNVVYLHYYEKIIPADIWSTMNSARKVQLTLGDLDAPEPETEQLVTVETDFEKAEKVYAALEKKSQYALQAAYYASLSAKDVFLDIYNFIILAFKTGDFVEHYKTLDYVLSVQMAGKRATREAHLLKGFCRFVETKSGVFYSEISPTDNVLALLAEHFADRFMNHSFIVHDVKRGLAVIYNTQEYIIQDVGMNAKFDYTDNEQAFQDLWRVFHKTIANEQRVSKKLQRQMLPLHFRKHITEFLP